MKLLQKRTFVEIQNVFYSEFIQSSGLLRAAGANQALHFFPSFQFYSSFISQTWEEQIWIVGAVRGVKAANGGPAHTWPHNLTSESAFSRWREERLGQIATEAQWLCPPTLRLRPANFERPSRKADSKCGRLLNEKGKLMRLVTKNRNMSSLSERFIWDSV